MQNWMFPWVLAIAIAGIEPVFASGACECPGFDREYNYLVRLSESAPPPKNPIPVDVGKGIEAKLDQLLDAIKSLTLDALKAAYFQGALHGVLVTSLIFTILIAFTRKGAS